ncbi:MAG: hypothetical protein ACI915_004752 [Gammaproteobacteria bacterium]
MLSSNTVEKVGYVRELRVTSLIRSWNANFWSEAAMMGQFPPGQNALFYEFSIDNHVPQDHLLRALDQFLDFGELRTYLQPYYSAIGRPSIDPKLVICMLLIGYC